MSSDRHSRVWRHHLGFGYGVGNHRITKTVSNDLGTELALQHREHYVHDAQGNVMAIYRYTPAPDGITPLRFEVTQRPIYGSSRLGLDADIREAYDPFYEENTASLLGKIRYELTDHLGNVCAVVSDALEGYSTDADPEAEEYHAELLSAQEYEPFGSLLPGRNFSSDSYRFGFQGQEKDDEINGGVGSSYAFEYRIHDPRVGRFLSIDPLAAKYPFYSPYAFSGNRMIDMIELEGLEPIRNRAGFNGQLGTDWGFGGAGASAATGWQRWSAGAPERIFQCPDCYDGSGNAAGTGLQGGALMWQRRTWITATNTTTGPTVFTPTPGSRTTLGANTPVTTVTNPFVRHTTTPTAGLTTAVTAALGALTAPVPAPTTTPVGAPIPGPSSSTGPTTSPDGQTRTTVLTTTTAQAVQTTTTQNVVTISFNTTLANIPANAAILQGRFNALVEGMGSPANVVYDPTNNGWGMSTGAMGGANQAVIGTAQRQTITGGNNVTTTTTTTTQSLGF